LDRFRKAKNLSWGHIRKKLLRLQQDLKSTALLRAAIIPQREREWERI
jgi:hypothetical protein